MDGDIAPLPGIVEAAEEFGAAVMVDDAHASGVLGRDGRGSVDHFGLHGRVAIQVGTLSKAVGSLGGYVAGSQALREILTQRARPFLFSTSHPPAVVAACREAIRVMQEEPQLQERLWANTRSFKAELTRLGFDTGVSETPITPVMMGDPDTAGRFSDRLIEEGVFAQPVVFPTVAIDKSRLRTIVTAAHADEQLDHGACRVRPCRPRAGADRRLMLDPGSGSLRACARFGRRGTLPIPDVRRPPSRHDGPMTDRQARDLPLDAHVHTNLSPDSNVAIDDYAASALERGIAEIAITDHVDFEPGAPAFALHDVRGPRTDRPRRGRTMGSAGRPDPLRGRAHLRPLVGSRHPGPPRPPRLRLHDRLGPRPGRFAVQPAARRRLGRGQAAGRDRRASFDEVVAAARSGLFDAIGHIDGVKRYVFPHVTPADFEAAPELYEPILHALVESGTALEVNTSGLRYPIRRSFPHPGDRRPLPRARRAGRDGRLRRPPRSTSSAGAWRDGYAIAADAGFSELTFRRGPGAARVAVPIPAHRIPA